MVRRTLTLRNIRYEQGNILGRGGKIGIGFKPKTSQGLIRPRTKGRHTT